MKEGEYGRITSKELAPFIGKEVEIEITEREKESAGAVGGRMKRYCHICKKETEHNSFKPHFLSGVEVCGECRTIKAQEEA